MGDHEAGAKRILIVDDEEDVLNVMYKRLTAVGYEVSQAKTGHEALLKSKSFLPDLIIMDIVLPDLDGSDVVKAIHREPVTQMIPVIFLSGIVTPDEQGLQTEVTVDGRRYYAVPKPITFHELLKQVERVLT